MADTRGGGSRLRRPPVAAGLVVLCSMALGSMALGSMALGRTSYAMTPAPAEAPPTVCGGLVADAAFAPEAAGLGHGHACEHLRLRDRAGGRTAVHLASSAAQAPATTARAAAAGPARIGRWSAARNPGTQTVGIAAVLLHTGEVLLFGDVENSGLDTSGYLLDPATGTGHDVPAPAPIFCGSLTPLSDGRILSVGGSDPNPRGIEDVWLFDPRTEQWLEQPPTPEGRYYPTSTRLPDGRVLVAAGTQVDGVTRNPNIEVYTPPATGGTLGTLEVVGAAHPTSTYPHQLVMPDGRLLQIDRGVGTFVLDPRSWTWRNLPRHAPTGEGSAHLLLPGGPRGSNRVMVMGGNWRGTALAHTQYYEYGAGAAGWRRGRPMPTPRSHLNVVQVPDGSAYAVGGNSTGLRADGQHQTMHFDPATGRWRNVAVQGPRRAYHSTALLLPDGRIMSAGDNAAGGGLQRIDFYSPPYLYNGPRPRVTFAPRLLRYDGRFTIRTAGPTATRAVLMAPGSTTHANEMNARHVPLRVTRTPRGFTATAPRANAAPPGYYMLFALTADGVPSVARWVRLTG